MDNRLESRQCALVNDLPPFAKELGVNIVEHSRNEVVGKLSVTQRHANRNGAMHGGAIISFADTLGGLASALNLDYGQSTITIESKTNFLRAISIGDQLVGVCQALQKGATITVWQTKIFRSDSKLAAIITQTQLTTVWSSK